MSALSRCRCGSTKPGSTARPPASIVRAASASMRGSIAAIRSPSMAMSTVGRSSQTRAFVISRSTRLSSSPARGYPGRGDGAQHPACLAACHWHEVPDTPRPGWQPVALRVVPALQQPVRAQRELDVEACHRVAGQGAAQLVDLRQAIAQGVVVHEELLGRADAVALATEEDLERLDER